MIAEIKFFIKSIFKEKNVRLLDAILFVVGMTLILLFSGIGYTTFEMSSKAKIVLYAFAFIYFASLFIFNLKIGVFLNIKRRKKIPAPSPFTCFYVITLLLAVLSFLINKNKSINLNTYISFALSLSISYFVLKRFKPGLIMKSFKNIIFILSLLSIIIFLYTYFSREFFSNMFFSNERIIFGNHFFLSTDFISGLTYSYFWRLRLTSIFWEPGVFGSMLIAALVCDFFTKDKLSFIRSIVFIVAIILTKSTAAYLVLFLYFCLLICYFLRKSSTKQFVFLFFIVALFIPLLFFLPQVVQLLAKIMPSVFGKFVDSSSSISFTTRLYSFSFYMRVFATNPLGSGGVTAGLLYNNFAEGLANSETSTFGLAIASFGFAGILYSILIIVGFLFNKRVSAVYRLLLALVVLLISNSQGQIGIIGINILYFIPLSLLEWPECIKKYNSSFLSNNNKTISNIMFAKNDDGQLSTNIVASLILKGVSIILAFFTIPIYLRYFNYNNSTYGVWLAITSILTIITVFDFGMGNGLKNRLIKNINDKKDELSKTFISTTYLLTSIIGIIIFAVCSVIIFSLNDNVIHALFFSDETSPINYLSFKLGFSLIMFAIGTQFALKNINYILQAHQRNAITGLFMLITNVCLLSFAFIFSRIIPSEQKIISLAIAYNIFLNVPLLVASIVLFSKQYKNIRPSFSSVNFRESRSVVFTGVKFFIIQIGTLFIWSSNEFIILLVFDKASLVTEYSEYYRLFSLLPTILGTVIQQPIWTAIAKADVEGDLKRIKRYSILLVAITAAFVLINIVLVLSLPFVFDIWLGSNAPTVTISKQLTFCLYTIVYLITMCIVVICNALSLFKAQIVSSVIGIIVKIPLILLSVYVLKFTTSWELVIVVNMICYIPDVIYGPFEIGKYIKNRKKKRCL